MPGFIADPIKFRELTGVAVHPKAFDLEPLGSRIVVVQDAVPTDWKGISLPEDVRDREIMGSGWVLSVGDTAGLLGRWAVPHPGIPVVESPEALLYRHIYFGQHIGKVIRLSVRDRSYKGALLMMSDRDILCFDHIPERKPWEMED